MAVAGWLGVQGTNLLANGFGQSGQCTMCIAHAADTVQVGGQGAQPTY